MTVTLSSHAAQLARNLLALHRERSLEQLVEEGLGVLAQPASQGGKFATPRDPKRAAARIRQRRRGVKLSGLRIKDLVNEGRP